MTCFWDGILTSLKFTGNAQLETISNRFDLIKYFKEIGSEPTDELIDDICNVAINNEKLSKQQVTETIDAIKNFNIDSIYFGYYCSTCDPFLILFAALSKCTIQHKYVNNLITYKFEITNNIAKNIVLRFESNSSHFWFQSHF